MYYKHKLLQVSKNKAGDCISSLCTRLCSWYWLVKPCRCLLFLSISSHTFNDTHSNRRSPLSSLCIFAFKEIDWPLKLKRDELRRCFHDWIRFSDVPVVHINCTACAGPRCQKKCSRLRSWAQWWPSGSDGDDTDSSVHLGTSTHGSFVTTWSHTPFHCSTAIP